MTDHIAVPSDPKRNIIIVVGVVLAINLAIAGIFATRSTTSTSDLPTAIQELFPARDNVVQTQSAVGIRLDKDWTGELTLDGTPLPVDQYEPNGIDIGRIFWKPGSGQEFSVLRPGNHTLMIHYWPRKEGPGGTNDLTFSWNFKAA